MPTYRLTHFRFWCFLRSWVAAGVFSLIPSISPAGTLVAGDLAPRGAPDGRIDAADVLILQRIITTALSPTPVELLIGDVAPLGNPDGDLNAGDLVVLMRAVTGEITLPPIMDDTAPPPANTNLITVTDNGSGSVSVTGSVGSVEPGATITLVNFETGATAVTTAGSDGSFSMVLAALSGEVFGITVTDLAGNDSVRVSMAIGSALSIEIAAPIASAVIDDDRVSVRGTFIGPPDTAITVNGVVACIYGASFFAPDIPLDTGSNTLDVVATTRDEITATATVEVTSSGPAAVKTRIAPSCGPAPHTVSVSIESSTVALQSIDVDFDGDGTLEIAGGDPNGELSFTYPNPGDFNAAIWAHDTNATVHYSQLPVQTQDVAVLDGLLRSAYDETRERLRAGALEGALNAIAPPSRDRYRPVFDTLAPNLATIVDQLGVLDKGIIGTEVAEYLLIRSPGAGGRAFLIYFIRGDDGVWRIAEM